MKKKAGGKFWNLVLFSLYMVCQKVVFCFSVLVSLVFMWKVIKSAKQNVYFFLILMSYELYYMLSFVKLLMPKVRTAENVVRSASVCHSFLSYTGF